MKRISKDELKNKLENGEVNLIEVLSENEFNLGHIKGAVNIPLNRIGTEAKAKFDTHDEIVVYCTDEDCTASPVAAKKLTTLGFENVYHYGGGKEEWRKAGLPMES